MWQNSDDMINRSFARPATKTMIAKNKYTRVVVIAAINIVIVCFLYKNSATHNNNKVLEKEGEEKDDEDNEISDKHSDKSVSNIHEQVSETEKTLKIKDDSAIAIPGAKIREKTIDTITAVKSLKEEHQNSTKHDAVMSMKNSLSVHMTAVKMTKNTTLPPPHSLGKKLKERLLDSSDIDLSPPNPVLVPFTPTITDQVSNYY